MTMSQTQSDECFVGFYIYDPMKSRSATAVGNQKLHRSEELCDPKSLQIIYLKINIVPFMCGSVIAILISIQPNK
jgi:hypothetical protein